MYLIESGILKARYDYPSQDWELNEAMLAGTIAGEVSRAAFLPHSRLPSTYLSRLAWLTRRSDSH